MIYHDGKRISSLIAETIKVHNGFQHKGLFIMKIAVIGGIGALPRQIGVTSGGNSPEEFGDIYLDRFLHRVAKYQTPDLVVVVG
ncbi:MAG: hypothetical protein RR060_00295, partial [Victivallaceae bacterium]